MLLTAGGLYGHSGTFSPDTTWFQNVHPHKGASEGKDWERCFLINILPLLGINSIWILTVYEGGGAGGKRSYSCSYRWPTSHTEASFYEQCHTSLRSGSVSGLEVSVVVEELSSSAKESFSSSSGCFPFPLLSFSSRFFCGLALRWSIFPFPKEIMMLQILSSSSLMG